ncbi:MAG: amidohydrolase family protein [Candidatus Helarchaeota archaeon]|nr:amidohydrolase family protein [Candidatus Helarchaeota archaeon]
MIIDCHYHLNKTILPIEDLIKQMDKVGVEKIVLMASMCDQLPPVKESLLKMNRFLLTHNSFRWLGRKFTENFEQNGDFRIRGTVVKIGQDPDNEPVFQATESYPDKFLGWIFVNPRGKLNQVEEFNKWKINPRAIGVKAHPFWHRFAPIDLLPVAKQVSALGKPMLLHLGFEEKGNFDALLQAVPDLKLILAHAAFPYYSKTWKAIKDNPNIFIDLSQTVYVDETITRHAVKMLGAERCLFGTDGPYGSPGAQGEFDLGLIKRRIEKLFPEENVQAKLLGENLQNLIKS